VAAHLSSCHKKWLEIFYNCYLYRLVQKIIILMSAYLRGRYQKAHRSLVSVVFKTAATNNRLLISADKSIDIDIGYC
jgi:hypothetical protein